MINRSFAAVLLIMSITCAAPNVVAKDETRLLFAIPEDGGTLEPIAAWANGRYFEPPIGGSDVDNNRFLLKMKPGATFNAVQGGSLRGVVTVTQLDKERLQARVKGNFKARGNMLAVNFKPAKHAPPQLVTDGQKRALTLVALEKLKAKQVPADALKTMTSQFVGRDLNNDGVGEIIATFFVKSTPTSKQAHAIFIIAAVNGDFVSQQVVQHQRVKQKDLMSGLEMSKVTAGFLTPLFFDNIDFDGDGKDEVITRVQTFEGTWYHIWIRDHVNKWDDPYKVYHYREAF